MKSRIRGRTKGSGGGGSRKQAPGPKLFGSSIDDSREGIPRVVMIAQAYFESYGVQTEGLFRISPEKPVLDELVDKFDSGAPVDISSYAESGHTMAGLLKRYFREMPEPLIPFDLYEPFVNCVQDGAEPATKVLRLQKVVSLLSQPRHATLKALIEICVLVAANQSANKMGPDNLATVFAPTLFRPRGGDLSQSMRDMPQITQCVLLFISNFERIFGSGETQAAETKKPPVEMFVPEKAAMPTLPSLPPLMIPGKNNGGRRGSVTIDNAGLAPLLAKKEGVHPLEAHVGQQVYAMYEPDGMWYAATLERFDGLSRKGVVVFVDYGNRQECSEAQITTDLATLPPSSPVSRRAVPPLSPKVVHPSRKSDLPQAPPRAPQRAATVSGKRTLATQSSPNVVQVPPRPPQRSNTQGPRPSSSGRGSVPLSPRAGQPSPPMRIPSSRPPVRPTSGTPVTAPRPAPMPRAPLAQQTCAPSSLPPTRTPSAANSPALPVRAGTQRTSAPPSSTNSPTPIARSLSGSAGRGIGRGMGRGGGGGGSGTRSPPPQAALPPTPTADEEQLHLATHDLDDDPTGPMALKMEPVVGEEYVFEDSISELPRLAAQSPPRAQEEYVFDASMSEGLLTETAMLASTGSLSSSVLVNKDQPPPQYAEFGSDDDDDDMLAPRDEENYTDTLELPPLPAKSEAVLSEMRQLAEGGEEEGYDI